MKFVQHQINWRRFWPYLLIGVVAGLVMIPQWHANAAYVGIDSLFHMNRFYDTMMQIKTGHYSYFQSFYGFSQSGRIVNAVYGPLFAYLNGLFLLISGTWVHYQLLSSFLLFLISGFLMYRLAIHNQVLKGWAVVIALCYMFSTPVLYWINGQQFTAWGAAFVPLLMQFGTDMVRHHRVAWLKLALAMTLVLQVHNVTSAICALALLPFFISGVLTTQNRRGMVLDLLKAIGLTLVLSFNVWGAMLELFSSNHLLPVLPDLHLASDTIHFFSGTTRLSISALVLFIMAILYLIFSWRHLTLVTKVIIITGLVFLWIPTSYFPWTWLSRLVPAVDSMIQNPIRFLIIPYVLLFLAVGIMLSDQRFHWVRYGGAVLTILVLVNLVWKDVRHVEAKNQQFNSKQVVISKRLTTINASHPEQIRAALRSNQLQRVLQMVNKPTPDYLPVKQRITVFQYQSFHPYAKYRTAIINTRGKVKHSVSGNQMTVSWFNPTHHEQLKHLAVVKYRHSIVSLNGQYRSNIATTAIGTMIVKGRSGWNHLTIHYQSALWFRALMLVSLLGWGGLLGGVIYRVIRRNH